MENTLSNAHWVKIVIPQRLTTIETKGELFERALTEWAKEEIHENNSLSNQFKTLNNENKIWC